MTTMIANIYTMHTMLGIGRCAVLSFLTVSCRHYYCNLYFTNENISNKCQILDVKTIFSDSGDFEFNHSAMETICASEVKRIWVPESPQPARATWGPWLLLLPLFVPFPPSCLTRSLPLVFKIFDISFRFLCKYHLLTKFFPGLTD